jgi:hypothetical protein
MKFLTFILRLGEVNDSQGKCISLPRISQMSANKEKVLYIYLFFLFRFEELSCSFDF